MLPKFLERAREDAARKHLSVDYRCADIREPIAPGPFDAAVLWFYSFGYHSDRENLDVLRNASRALKPGGKLLFDQYNVSALARAADHYSVLDLGSSLLIQKPICDLETGRWGASRIVIRDGAIRRSSFTCRCYSPVELKQMLELTGFSGLSFFGDGFQALELDSARLIVLATKDAEP
jgi:SAM-dependent methyltransferase